MAVEGLDHEACGAPPPMAFGSVLGAQTAQRAEVWGACRALAIFGRCASRSICVVTDSAYLMGGASAGCVRQSNPDLLKALAAQGRSCSERGVAVSYRKVRAHTERRRYQEVTQGDSQVRADALGNLQADALAGEGAALLQLPELLIRVATEGEALSCALMGRFTAIEKGRSSKATERTPSFPASRGPGLLPPACSKSASESRGTCWVGSGEASSAASAAVSSGFRDCLSGFRTTHALATSW